MTRTLRTTPALAIVALLVLDVIIAIAVLRLPARLILPPAAEALPRAVPSFAAVLSGQAVFVATEPLRVAESYLIRVPLDRPGARPSVQHLGRDWALFEPVMGLDAFMPTGSRWAWNGRTLLLAAPARSLGANRISIALIGPEGLVAPPRVIEGTRPSAGWARDHFEVAYVTPAPPPSAGRVQWVVDIDERGVVSNERIVSAPGSELRPFAWPGGIRTHVEGAGPESLMLPDGTSVSIPREGRRRARPYLELGEQGNATVHFVASTMVRGSPFLGRYTARARIDGITVEGTLGAQVAGPRYTVSRGVQRVTFETEREAHPGDLIVARRGGVLHLVDHRGFHVRLRDADLQPLDPRASRLVYLAGALGVGGFYASVAGLLAAHLLAMLALRIGRTPERSARFADVAALAAMLIAGSVAYLIWKVGALPGATRSGEREALVGSLTSLSWPVGRTLDLDQPLLALAPNAQAHTRTNFAAQPCAHLFGAHVRDGLAVDADHLVASAQPCTRGCAIGWHALDEKRAGLGAVA